MRRIPAVLAILILVVGVVGVLLSVKFAGNKVLGSASDNEANTTATPQPTLTLTPSPSPIPTATLTPSPLPTLTPTLTPTPVVISPVEMDALFARFSSEFGVNADMLKRIAACESGFNTNATNRDYRGLFQFSPASWGTIRQMMGQDASLDLRVVPEESIKAAAFAISVGRASLWPNCR